jgi:large subunit ribosomal protein L10
MSVNGNIPKRKLETVAKLRDSLESYNTVGVVEMSAIGAKTVQKLRADLRSRGALMVVAKNTLMMKAIEETTLEGSEKLAEFVSGPVAFLFTNQSPYAIANYLETNKVKAPAKSGQIAQRTVTIPKMNTGFPPGTIISELNSVGLPTRIEGGTVAISEDTVVVRAGERVSTTLASILSRLEIEPFEVGLSLDVVLENGEIIEHDDLLIDFDAIKNDLIFAHQQARNLSINAAVFTDETATQIIANAHNKALSVASEIGYVTVETADRVIGSAHFKALALLKAVVEKNSSAVPAELAKLVA